MPEILIGVYAVNRAVIFLIIISSLGVASATWGQVHELTLTPRTQVPLPEIPWTAAEQHWLDSAESLRVGVAGDTLPPLMMNNDDSTFEGIAADYIWLTGRATDKKMVIRRYQTAGEVEAALVKGDVDIIAIHTPQINRSTPLLISRPYLLDEPVMLHKTCTEGSCLHKDRERTIAYVGDEATGKLISSQFPQASLLHYAYSSEAVAAIEYNMAEQLWINASAAAFYRNQGSEKPGAFRLTNIDTNLNVSFAVARENPVLLNVLDKVLTSLPLHSRMRIASNWGLDNRFVIKHNPLVLSREDLSWISHHPLITVRYPSQQPPLSFTDDEGMLSGYLPSLMRIIGNRTGLQFVSAPRAGSPDVASPVIDAVFLSETMPSQDDQTRSYAISPWVLVGRKAGNGLPLNDMKGMQVVIAGHSSQLNELARRYPSVHFRQVAEPEQALQEVASHRADAAVVTKMVADYLISNHFGQLSVASTVSLAPARFVMRINDSHSPLISIINRALTDISPQAQQHYLAAWINAPVIRNQLIWDAHSRLFIIIALVCALIAALIVVRNRYLKQDIRNRLRYEKRLEDQLRFTRTLIDESPVALYVRDRETRMVQCNNTYLQFFGGDAARVIGRTLEESAILTPESVQEFQNIYRVTLRSARPGISRREIHMPDGSRVLVQHWTLPYRDHSGDIQGIIGGFIDVTEQDRLLRDLTQAREAADNASKSKSLFLAQMSHEIRTPLNALIGLLEIEHKKISSPEQREDNIRVAWESSQALLSLVGNILDMAKIESGTHRVCIEPVELRACIDTVITLFSYPASQKALDLQFSSQLRHSVAHVDRTMLTQIASNLISNAVKFSENGTVTITLDERSGDSADLSHYTLGVRDTGPGMTQEQALGIFEPFMQAHDSAHNALGTGLGLSICKQLTALLGGELSVESEPGKGSLFKFQFPAIHGDQARTEENDLLSTVASGNARALIVDDHAPNRLLLSQQLTAAGYQVIAAENATQAVACWDSAALPFDIVLTDCNMPGMDGFRLTRLLREKEQQQQLTPRPIFGFTAMAEEDVRLRGQQAGMTDCLFKPLNIRKLYESISQHLPSESIVKPEATTEDPPEVAQLKKLAGSGEGDYRRLAQLLVETNDEDLAVLYQALRNEDEALIASQSHRLLGTARILHAANLQNICQDLKKHASSGNNRQLMALYQRCASEITHIRALFSQ
ncbi:ATP-binding protein [Pantoea trifolii]|uniref:ATP-binding protein n=1 Tax=Pantoea trifolii TaxID=2968030 RepID=UPI003ED8D9B6